MSCATTERHFQGGASQPSLVLTDGNGIARLAELELDESPDIVLLDDDHGDRSWCQLVADRPCELPSASPGDQAILCYTSGTTGPPKGVPLTHNNIAAQIEVLLGADLLVDDDRVLLPLHHVHPLVAGMFTPLARGMPIVFPYSLTGPRMVRALNETDATIVRLHER